MKTKLLIFLLMLTSSTCFASVESSLYSLQTVLLTQILPIFAVIALGLAAFQFFIGSSRAKQNLGWAIVGCGVLFGAQSIVDLIARIVR